MCASWPLLNISLLSYTSPKTYRHDKQNQKTKARLSQYPRGAELILIRMDGVPLSPSQEDPSCTLGLALSPAQGGDGGSRCGESVKAWCVGGCGRTFPCLLLFLWQDQEPLRGGHPLWHQRGLATLGSWACELPQVIRERLEKTVTRKEISREGRSNKALNNSPSVESHWGHRPRD